MSDLVDPTPPTSGTARTNWHHLADADPIELRDPLAELLGVVPDGEPVAVGFPDVVLAAGHACPTVSGAYRSTQLALDDLYGDELPVRSDIEVTVGGEPDDHGLGPMANVVSHLTGADRETGFAGFGGYGGREDLLSFEPLDGPGRTFEFRRRDTDEAVRVSFAPHAAGISPPGEGETSVTDTIPKLVAGEATDAERGEFHEQWHDRVQRILDAEPGEDSPFTLRYPES
ncbi:hypothetical protein [Halobacterium sp. R2-5]|uniref:hypothetical protein n=1 Tax=Halobacterium sp. R2-5 TaxID=2715751 RepID=UPI0014210062|nr:hypothetical protein [Halobacterium sp. R2-5]NIB98968.1 hypothetical protein [Halobacterium sp. R2-5]